MSWQFPWGKRRCAACQMEVLADWTACPYCGRNLGMDGQTPPAPRNDGVAASAGPAHAGGQQSWLHPQTEPMPPHLRDAPIQAVSEGNIGWLVPLDGPNLGKLFEIVGRTLIGAGADSAIHLDEPSVSGRHAEISLGAQNRFRLTDLGSRNGTYLNDRRISSEELVDGDNIRIGRTTFRFKTKR